MSEFDQKLGARLRSERRTQGKSQEEIAAALGVSFQQLQKYEKGVNRVSSEQLVNLAKILGVPFADLLDDTPVEVKPTNRAQLQACKTIMAFNLEQLEAFRLFAKALGVQHG